MWKVSSIGGDKKPPVPCDNSAGETPTQSFHFRNVDVSRGSPVALRR